MSKKLIRLKSSSDYTDTAGVNMYFCMASAKTGVEGKYNYRKLLTNFTTCRESLVHTLRNRMITENVELPVDYDNLRLVASFSNRSVKVDETKELVFYAKQVLNMMETEAGWENSVITTAKYIGNDNNLCFLLTGSKNWMASPQLISMYALILRSVYTYIKNIDKEQVERELNSIEDVRRLFNKISSSDMGDADHVGVCRKHFYNIMKNHDKIFEGGHTFTFDLNGDSNKKGYNYNSGYGGITSFCQNNAGPTMKKRFSEFVK
jgi:hypothetical protein